MNLDVHDTDTWMADRACNDAVDPEVFFPPAGADPVEARQICAACPVAVQCLDYALRIEKGNDTRNGVYGGLSARERRNLVRRQRRAQTDQGAAA